MAENTIDTLALEISSNAASASKGLDRLTASLMGLDKATGRLQTGKFSKISAELQAFSKATAKLKGLNVPDFSGLANSIGALGKINFNDSGITKTINALKRLGETDLSGFDTNSFSKIAQAIQDLSHIPDVSNNLNRFISSISKLVNAGDKTGAVANDFPRFADALNGAVNKISAAGDISESVNLFVQSIGRLATAGNKTGQTAAQLDALADSVLQFFNRMQSAPDISDKTIRMTEALGQLASVGGKVGTATGSASKAFTSLGNSSKKSADTIIKAMDKAVSSITKAIQKMASLLGKGALTIAKGAKSIVSSFTLIGRSNKGLNSATTSLRNLFRAALPILGIRQLINWGRDAVETASSLTEVQNIVDVTFGDMKSKVEELAKTSIGDFGMSELTLKQISSRFQAMGTAMGFTQGKMSDMSIELTKLAADMASFYNVSQKDVAKDLEAIFTGMSRPLRTYGIDLTEATLSEWAMKNGMDSNIKSMTQAEKTLLRYQYVLANTGAAQGDFARTAGTWANQTRILAQTFQALGAIIGRVFINALKPFVSSLNSVMQKVISFAKTVADALGTIFGWTFEVSGGGVLDDMGEIEGDLSGAEDASGGVADGLGDAAGNADKLKKKLSVLPFDQLNQLASDLDNASTGAGGGNGGSGGGGGAGGAGAGGLSTEIVPTESILKKYESDIKSLEQLGEYIGDALIKAMQGIDWDSVYEGARNFGTGLADFLNGLISPELFGETGRLVSNSLNTALYALNSFGETFDWTNFGNSIATGINSFFKNFKVTLAADTFDTFANGILDAMVAVFGEDGIEWSRIGTKISSAVKKALKGIEWGKAYEAAGGFGKGLATFMNKLITPETFAEIGKTLGNTVGSVVRGVKEWVTEADFYNWGVSLGTALNNFFDTIDWNEVGLTLDGLIEGLVDFMKGLVTTGKFESFGEKIGSALSKVNWLGHLFNAGRAIVDAIKDILVGAAHTPAGKFIEALAIAFPAAKVSIGLLELAIKGVMISSLTGGTTAAIVASIGTLATIIGGGLVAAVAQVAVNEYTGGPKTAFQGLADIVGGWFVRLAQSETVQKASDKFRDFLGKAFSFTGKDFDGIGQETTPEIEVSVDANTEKFEKKVVKSAELLNESLPSETSVNLDATIKAKNIDLSKLPQNIQLKVQAILDDKSITKKEKEIKIEAVLKKVKDKIPNKDRNIKGIAAEIVDTYEKSGKKLSVKNVHGEVSETSHQQGKRLTVDSIEGQISKTERQPGKTLTLKDVAAYTAGLKWLDTANKKILAEAITKQVGWDKDPNKEITVSAFTKAVSFLRSGADTTMTLSSAYTKLVEWAKSGADKNISVKATTQKVGVTNNAVTVAAKTSSVGWQSNASRVLSGISGIISSVTKANGLSLVLSAVLKIVSGVVSLAFKKNGGIYYGGKWHGVSAAATGGSFNMGQLFVAREAGPELVGTIGGHTAVMNNDQIVASVAAGVYRAVLSAFGGLSSYFSEIALSLSDIPDALRGVQINTEFFRKFQNYRPNYSAAEPILNQRLITSRSAAQIDTSRYENQDLRVQIKQAVIDGMTEAMMRNSNNQPINVYATLKTENDEVLARAVTRGQQKLDYRMNPTPQF